jgi:hypothetical protein
MFVVVVVVLSGACLSLSAAALMRIFDDPLHVLTESEPLSLPSMAAPDAYR